MCSQLLKVDGPDDARKRLGLHILSGGRGVVAQVNMIYVVDQLDQFYLRGPHQVLLANIFLYILWDNCYVARVDVYD